MEEVDIHGLTLTSLTQHPDSSIKSLVGRALLIKADCNGAPRIRIVSGRGHYAPRRWGFQISHLPGIFLAAFKDTERAFHSFNIAHLDSMEPLSDERK